MIPDEKAAKARLLGELRRAVRQAATRAVVAKIDDPAARPWWIIASLIQAAVDIAKQTGNIDMLMQAIAAATGAKVERQVQAMPAPANDARFGVVHSQADAEAMIAREHAVTICPECSRVAPAHFSWCSAAEHFSKDEVTS